MRVNMLQTMVVCPSVIRQLHPPLFIYRVGFIGQLEHSCQQYRAPSLIKELSMLSGDTMLSFGAGLLVGLVAAILVYRNNKTKFEAAVEVAVAAALKAKKGL